MTSVSVLVVRDDFDERARSKRAHSSRMVQDVAPLVDTWVIATEQRLSTPAVVPDPEAVSRSVQLAGTLRLLSVAASTEAC